MRPAVFAWYWSWHVMIHTQAAQETEALGELSSGNAWHKAMALDKGIAAAAAAAARCHHAKEHKHRMARKDKKG